VAKFATVSWECPSFGSLYVGNVQSVEPFFLWWENQQGLSQKEKEKVKASTTNQEKPQGITNTILGPQIQPSSFVMYDFGRWNGVFWTIIQIQFIGFSKWPISKRFQTILCNELCDSAPTTPPSTENLSCVMTQF
jgi:hypothetical protein